MDACQKLEGKRKKRHTLGMEAEEIGGTKREGDEREGGRMARMGRGDGGRAGYGQSSVESVQVCET